MVSGHMRSASHLEILLPKDGNHAASVVRGLALAAPRMEKSTRAVWISRFDHVYGDLSGQRKVDIQPLLRPIQLDDAKTSIRDVLFALQTYFVLLADLVAVAAASGSPSAYLRGVGSLSGSALSRKLHQVSRGSELEDHGIRGARSAFAFDWYVDLLDAKSLESSRVTCQVLAQDWDQVFVGDEYARDVLAEIYHHLLPQNLRHILGEVHTPLWLAETLIEDLNWQPGATLIDPFAGTGVFLLAALNRGRRLGEDPVAILEGLCGIDLNPIACAAARANLVLAITAGSRRPREQTVLPILCADSIAPALQSGLGGQASLWGSSTAPLWIDGELLDVPDLQTDLTSEIADALREYGLTIPAFLTQPRTVKSGRRRVAPNGGSRRFWEQLAVTRLAKADFMATNPPWIGWEYISRAYRSYLEPAWQTYGLYSAKGRDASFLKEDLSTLALVVAWDRYLRGGGRCASVIRAATMTSQNAAHGLRRLSITPRDKPVRLELIRQFNGLKVFRAQVESATWMLEKGVSTEFPVPVRAWRSSRKRWQPNPSDPLACVRENVTESESAAKRIVPEDVRSRWVTGPAECLESLARFRGTNPYRARTGVFTGGANAVFYLERVDSDEPRENRYRNVTARAKRSAPSREIELEPSLVMPVVRGRDLRRWCARAGALILCPHTQDTRMRAIPEADMSRNFPLALKYLHSMRKVLDKRRGFAGWERGMQEESFYAIQRVGSYTFSPFKVGWRYIATDFVTAVIPPDSDGRPQLGNDKVMFAAFDNAEAAYFVCGVLTSDPVRWSVVSSMTGTQIPASVVDHVAIPAYDPTEPTHVAVASACRAGHRAVAKNSAVEAAKCLAEVNKTVAAMFGLTDAAMRAYHVDLTLRFGKNWFDYR